MKYLVALFVLFISSIAYAQDAITGIKAPALSFEKTYIGDPLFLNAHNVELNIPSKVNLLAVAASDGFFHRTYALDTEGETISSGFMPSPYYMPNNNLLIITGKQYRRRDSLNPYGADDLAEWIFLGTVNNFISRLRLGRR